MFTDAIRNDRAPLGRDFPTLAEAIRNIRAPLNQCMCFGKNLHVYNSLGPLSKFLYCYHFPLPKNQSW